LALRGSPPPFFLRATTFLVESPGFAATDFFDVPTRLAAFFPETGLAAAFAPRFAAGLDNGFAARFAAGFAATFRTAPFIRFSIAEPSSAGERTVVTRAASSAANLSAAVPLPPEMTAPA
jgi:hypothetical protein